MFFRQVSLLKTSWQQTVQEYRDARLVKKNRRAKRLKFYGEKWRAVLVRGRGLVFFRPEKCPLRLFFRCH